jgi:hypothetical protein
MCVCVCVCVCNREKRMYEVVSYPWDLDVDVKQYFETVRLVDEETVYRQSKECEAKAPHVKTAHKK